MSNKLPNGWKEYKLGEVIEIFGGGTPRTDVAEYWNGEIAWLSVADFNHGRKYVYDTEKKISKKGVQNSSTKMLKKGDIIISARGTVGAIAVLRKEMAFNQSCYGIRALENITTNDYIYYLIKDTVSDLLQIAHGGVFDTITKDTFNEIDILLPPLPEQRAIASVLSSLDDKIDLLHRENKTLEAMAEALFRQWFIEEAKDEWQEVSLKDIYIFEKGFEPGSGNYLETEEEDAIRFIRVGDMLSYTPSVYIKKSLAKSTCTADDLLMSFDGTPGRLNFGVEGAYSSGIRRIYSLNPVYDNLGLKYLIFKSKHIQDTVNAHSSGTVILHASSSIDELTFSFPDERKLEEFNEMITPIFSKIQLNKRQFRILEKLRDTLLPKLMSGEVRVKYVEEEMASCRA